ncbi:hypothetical protein [Streptomyces avermitilis]|uniref:Uncharacterized protein n=2 Tax=Streptomyces avermitilis TaxID=33903 RepID=Q82RH0_STRAW|nr:hypothetical protein [Streptomyces sp. SID5469]BAC67882.1 hypothetical protein SAVERM_173 [Streptomyces avermitilis MA-4680 = NBRC 14893]
MLAGRLDETGDGWINMLESWATKGFKAGLMALVVIGMVQKFSLKAGLGALLLMVIALGLYDSRNDLADMFTDEVKNPSKGAPAVPGIVRGPDPLARVHSDGTGDGL